MVEHPVVSRRVAGSIPVWTAKLVSKEMNVRETYN